MFDSALTSLSVIGDKPDLPSNRKELKDLLHTDLIERGAFWAEWVKPRFVAEGGAEHSAEHRAEVCL